MNDTEKNNSVDTYNVEQSELSEKPKLGIDSIIDSVIHRVLDIEQCADQYVSDAYTRQKKEADKLIKEIDEYEAVLEQESDNAIRVAIARKLSLSRGR